MTPRTLLLALLAACGGGATQNGAGPLTAAELYPLGEGHVWSYDVETGVGPNALAISRVINQAGNTYEVRNDGGEGMTYEVREDGIFKPATGTYLLRAPFDVGETWDAGGGRTARIAAVDLDVDVPAGRFDRCVRVEETGGGDGREIATTYCPGVGVTMLEAGMTTQLSGMRASVHAKLRAYSLGDLDLE